VPPLLLALAAAAGAGRAAVDGLPPAPGDLDRLLPRGAAPVLLEGVVTGVAARRTRPGPEPGAPAREVLAFPVRALRLHGPEGALPAEGAADVLAEDAGPAPLPGDRVLVLGTARVPPGPRNPGGRDAAAEAADRGVSRVLDAAGPGSVVVAEPGGAWSPARAAARLREALLAAVDRAFEGRGRAFHAALLAGDPSLMDPDTVDAWRRTGTWHVLVVSGYHVALVAAAAAWLLGRAGARARLRACVTAGAAVAYAASTGFGVPAQRACVAVALVVLAPLVRRTADPFHSLCAGAGLLLALRPAAIGEPGFQLSFGAVLGLLRIAPAIGDLLFARRRVLRRFPVPAADRSPRRRAGDFLEAFLPASLAAWAATAPVLAHHFGTFAPVTAPANLLLVPLASAALGLGAPLLAIGLLAPGLSAPAGNAVSAALDGLVASLERLPGAWYAIPPPPSALPWVQGATLALAAARPAPGSLLAAAAALAALGAVPLAFPPRPDAPSVLALDAGHGLAVLADAGTARLLGDAGGRGPRVPEGIVLPALRARGALALDALVVSHEDRDHLSAARAVLETARVGALVVAERFGESADAEAVLEAAAREGVPGLRVAAGDRILWPGLEARVLHPPRGGGASPAGNAGSLVVLVRMDGLAALLPGDLEGPPLAELLRSDADLRADVLLLPHHGSPTAGDLVALAASTGASVAIASSGPSTRRVDGVPSPRAPRFLATDEEGAVLVTRAGVVPWR
jgi:competence protein ComEC